MNNNAALRKLIYGVAYYHEYMPSPRLKQDMEMMAKAGINTIRIAESTWSSHEPSNGKFCFDHVKAPIEAAASAGISVIVGTPTYAIPPWLAAEHPEVIVVTDNGGEKYGRRQNMDITSPVYLFYAQRVIRKLMEAVQPYSNVIGFQLDNETKHYNTAGKNVHKRFISYLRDKFVTVAEMNKAFGFNYWSNSVDSWENVPDPTGTINGSYRGEFEKFRRSLVDEFLMWQADIVREYMRDDQFITHNFDYAWKGYSYGLQPDVNHKSAAQAVTVAGCDIYHLSQSKLTGKEIAFGGDICRSLKGSNYMVIETQAQGHVNWTPYDGQLRLQAFSHIASGAGAVMYWHWHSIHNAIETYWKGLLSHDMLPNAPYREACTIGGDFARLSPMLAGLKKVNKVAMLVSNESLTGISCFPLPGGKTDYNDVFRWLYDGMYELNVECDMLFPSDTDRFGDYSMIVVPALYSAPDSLLKALRDYTANGGNLVATFKTGFSNENLQAAADSQPHILTDCFGLTYDQFTEPVEVKLTGDSFDLPPEERSAKVWMELLRPTTASAIAYYDHPFWKKHPAITENIYGKGKAVYIGCMTGAVYLKKLLEQILKSAGLWSSEQTAAFPIVIKSGYNQAGNPVHFYFNYSDSRQNQQYLHGKGTELISGKAVEDSCNLCFDPWGFAIIMEDNQQ